MLPLRVLRRSLASFRPVLPDIPGGYTPPEYTGPSKQELMELRSKHVNPGQFLFYPNDPFVAASGYMQYIWDEQGTRFLDLFGGIVTVGVGHAHPRITHVATEQMRRISHTTTIYLSDQLPQYCKELADKLPENLSNIYVVNSGSDANDLAMLMARLYTGNHTIIGTRNGYHGMSGGSMGETAIGSWKYPVPQPGNIFHAATPNMYRGQHQLDHGLTPEECGTRYAQDVAELVAHCTPNAVAAFVSEPIQGVGGTVDLPPGYLPQVYKTIRAAGGLCIADEVQTGFGRLGSHYWGFERAGVVPDIVCMAKSIGNGAPLAAVATSKEIGQVMQRGLHFNTYGGNPVCAAIGREVLKIIDEEGIQQNCAERGAEFLEGMHALKRKFPTNVGDVRGTGLMLGMEFVKDPTTKEANPELTVASFEKAREYGLLLGKGGMLGNVWRVKPPMCITKDDVKFALEVMEQSLADCGAK